MHRRRVSRARQRGSMTACRVGSTRKPARANAWLPSSGARSVMLYSRARSSSALRRVRPPLSLAVDPALAPYPSPTAVPHPHDAARKLYRQHKP